MVTASPGVHHHPVLHDGARRQVTRPAHARANKPIRSAERWAMVSARRYRCSASTCLHVSHICPDDIGSTTCRVVARSIRCTAALRSSSLVTRSGSHGSECSSDSDPDRSSAGSPGAPDQQDGRHQRRCRRLVVRTATGTIAEDRSMTRSCWRRLEPASPERFGRASSVGEGDGHRSVTVESHRRNPGEAQHGDGAVVEGEGEGAEPGLALGWAPRTSPRHNSSSATR